mmetsp:Transcript_4088/g.11242  ORF Transcript_4088/g.11242 Transcript_4088/m.11242 type:complete len:527 (-) Transcript_4088:24-1604(-)
MPSGGAAEAARAAVAPGQRPRRRAAGLLLGLARPPSALRRPGGGLPGEAARGVAHRRLLQAPHAVAELLHAPVRLPELLPSAHGLEVAPLTRAALLGDLGPRPLQRHLCAAELPPALRELRRAAVGPPAVLAELGGEAVAGCEGLVALRGGGVQGEAKLLLGRAAGGVLAAELLQVRARAGQLLLELGGALARSLGQRVPGAQLAPDLAELGGGPRLRRLRARRVQAVALLLLQLLVEAQLQLPVLPRQPLRGGLEALRVAQPPLRALRPPRVPLPLPAHRRQPRVPRAGLLFASARRQRRRPLAVARRRRRTQGLAHLVLQAPAADLRLLALARRRAGLALQLRGRPAAPGQVLPASHQLVVHRPVLREEARVLPAQRGQLLALPQQCLAARRAAGGPRGAGALAAGLQLAELLLEGAPLLLQLPARGRPLQGLRLQPSLQLPRLCLGALPRERLLPQPRDERGELGAQELHALLARRRRLQLHCPRQCPRHRAALHRYRLQKGMFAVPRADLPTTPKEVRERAG